MYLYNYIYIHSNQNGNSSLKYIPLDILMRVGWQNLHLDQLGGSKWDNRSETLQSNGCDGVMGCHPCFMGIEWWMDMNPSFQWYGVITQFGLSPMKSNLLDKCMAIWLSGYPVSWKKTWLVDQTRVTSHQPHPIPDFSPRVIGVTIATGPIGWRCESPGWRPRTDW